MKVRHFLTLNDLSRIEFNQLIKRAIELKAMQKAGILYQPFVGKCLTMIFEKASTRTRLSFELGMSQLGGSAAFLSTHDTQLGRGEPVEDSARVISSMSDIIMIRTFGHTKLETFASKSRVPVINGLTDEYHPCQLLADMMTFVELRGDIKGKVVTWIGDGNNMCHSYILAAHVLGFHLKICTPKAFRPDQNLLDTYSTSLTLVDTFSEAVENSDLVVTDVWSSMGHEAEQQERLKAFAGFQVTESLLDEANDDVLFMHCLPAHRGEEISTTLMDDKRSVVWQEAENRLHAQKALLELLLNNTQ